MWLSNFTLVWTYNVAFAFMTVSCLLNHFTMPVRKEIIQRYDLSCNRHTQMSIFRFDEISAFSNVIRP